MTNRRTRIKRKKRKNRRPPPSMDYARVVRLLRYNMPRRSPERKYLLMTRIPRHSSMVPQAPLDLMALERLSRPARPRKRKRQTEAYLKLAKLPNRFTLIRSTRTPYLKRAHTKRRAAVTNRRVRVTEILTRASIRVALIPLALIRKRNVERPLAASVIARIRLRSRKKKVTRRHPMN